MLLFLFLVPVLAGAASPQFNGINPAGGQRGAEVEVTITGERLNDAKGLLFYSPGIEVAALDAAEKGKVKAKLRIAADCSLGEHPLRLWTATGVSDLFLFQVGSFPELNEKEPNNDAAHAQPIALNTTVNGVIKDEDIDYFAVEAKKGQRITAEVEGMRLGLGMFDAWVAVLTKDGHQLAANDDNALLQQDPLASVVAPEDGTYLIAVRESTWGGSDKCLYRLHVGTFTQPLVAFPLGGQAGHELAVTLVSDSAEPLTKTVRLPDAPAEKYPVFAEQDGVTAPSANAVRVSPFPNVLASVPNNDREHATATDLPLPVAFNGVLAEQQSAGFFKFKASKGDQLDVTVWARRLRSPLDSAITLYDAKGKQLASNDDAAGPDSYLRFKPPEDGEYFLAVRDQLGRGGPAFAYRVEVTRAAPQVALSIPEVVKDTQERQTIVVPRGNRFATMLHARRSDFEGEFKPESSDLPAGVSLAAGALAADAMPAVFEAAPDSAVEAKLCALNVSAADPAKPVSGKIEQSVELIHGQNNAVYLQRQVDKLAVAVAEEAPCKIEIVPPKVPLLQGGAMSLKVVATRRDDCKAPISIAMLYNPPGIGSDATITIPADKSEASIPLSASADAKTSAWKIAAVANVDSANGKVWVSSQLADLAVAKPFVTAEIERANVEQGQPATVVCKMTQNVPFEGKAKVQLLGLPNKTSAPEMEITAADKEVRFAVATDAASPVGQHKGLFCQVTFDKDGEPLVENTGQGGVLRIDKPSGAKKEIAEK